jgi:hypothetical protein
MISKNTKTLPAPPATIASRRDLKSLQQVMARAIMRPLNQAGNIQTRWSDSSKKGESGISTARAAKKFIRPNDRLTSLERLQIYNRQYWYRVIDCFWQDFPGVRTILGEERFEQLAIRYINRHPSSSFTLRNLGRHLPRFIRSEPHWTQPHQKLAYDAARLEWSQIEAFDGLSLPKVSPADFQDNSSAAKARLQVQPYLQLLELDHPVDDFLLAIKKTDTDRNDASNAVGERRRKKAKSLPLPKPEKIFLAVHRLDESVYYKRLEPGAYRILRAIRRGKPLEEACLAALSRSSELSGEAVAARIQKWFANWASLGWFCVSDS